jgi:hypothetical protein
MPKCQLATKRSTASCGTEYHGIVQVGDQLGPAVEDVHQQHRTVGSDQRSLRIGQIGRWRGRTSCAAARTTEATATSSGSSTTATDRGAAYSLTAPTLGRLICLRRRKAQAVTINRWKPTSHHSRSALTQSLIRR